MRFSVIIFLILFKKIARALAQSGYVKMWLSLFDNSILNKY